VGKSRRVGTAPL